MSTTAPTTPRAESAERIAALAQIAAPLATGIVAPWLDPSAAAFAGIAYAATAALTAANYMNRLGSLADQLPGADILTAHRTTLGISTLNTGVALGVGTLGGPQTSDALLAGWMALPSVPGIISLGWWGSVGLTAVKLRRVLGRKKRPVALLQAQPADAGPVTVADQILKSWGKHISHPDGGTHRHQVLTEVRVGVDRWTGRIMAPAGCGVSVTKEAVSSVYQVPAPWITITPGAHAGEAQIEVSLKAPAELDPTTLAGAWKKRVARPGGLMPKTHLEQVTDDPNTGGQAAYVVADEDLDALKAPDRTELAGALRTLPVLVSYEPMANPRKAIIRTMQENPLEKGFPFPGLDVLKATKGGRVPIGKVISGHPSYFPMFDPVLGALHLVIIGTTGAGKGGAAQIVALGYHANSAALIYGDPKGASNPAIRKMAAYSGLQEYGALGALRVSHAVYQHRKLEAAKYELKNFQPSKMRPWCPTMLDEANQLLGPNVPNRKESVHIVKKLTGEGRFIGMPFVLINQVVNLDQLGGEQAIRANLINGGAWLILRTDSGQTNLADLPTGFEGIDPAAIPAVWKAEDDCLIYDPDIPEDDPRRTFGLGFMAAPGNRPAMQRIFTLEDATEHIRPELVTVPEDFPDWDDARLEEIANTPVPGFEEDDDSGAYGGGGPVRVSGVDLPRKEPSAEDQILQVLRDEADPLHLAYLDGAGDVDPEDFAIAYMDKATLLAGTGLKETTLANTLSRLTKENKIHRQDGARGLYGLGPAPQPDDTATSAAGPLVNTSAS